MATSSFVLTIAFICLMPLSLIIILVYVFTSFKNQKKQQALLKDILDQLKRKDEIV